MLAKVKSCCGRDLLRVGLEFPGRLLSAEVEESGLMSPYIQRETLHCARLLAKAEEKREGVVAESAESAHGYYSGRRYR